MPCGRSRQGIRPVVVVACLTKRRESINRWLLVLFFSSRLFPSIFNRSSTARGGWVVGWRVLVVCGVWWRPVSEANTRQAGRRLL